MREVIGELVAGERGHVMADDNPVRERLVHGHGEPAPQFGLTKDKETEPILGIHLVIGEEPSSERGDESARELSARHTSARFTVKRSPS